MNITILTIGSRGDVQPFVALGVGLKEAGHRIVAKLQTQGNSGFVRCSQKTVAGE